MMLVVHRWLHVVAAACWTILSMLCSSICWCLVLFYLTNWGLSLSVFVFAGCGTVILLMILTDSVFWASVEGLWLWYPLESSTCFPFVQVQPFFIWSSLSPCRFNIGLPFSWNSPVCLLERVRYVFCKLDYIERRSLAKPSNGIVCMFRSVLLFNDLLDGKGGFYILADAFGTGLVSLTALFFDVPSIFGLLCLHALVSLLIDTVIWIPPW